MNVTNVIVLDLLALSGCKHPSGERPEEIARAIEELNQYDCWRDVQRMLYKLLKWGHCRGQTREIAFYKVYVSRRSLRNLTEIVRKLTDIRERKEEILIKIRTLISMKKCGLLSEETYEGECKLTGFHAEEYCELESSLRKALSECSLRCCVLCVDKTFSEEHVLEIGRSIGVGIEILDTLKDANIRVVELIKKDI